MAAVLPISESEFDKRWPRLEKQLRDWYAAETATSFDAAVRAAADEDDDEEDDDGGLSIWDEMPELDSKRVVEALVKIEPLLGGKAPVDVIRAGGYGSADDLVNDLRPKLRARCRPDAVPAKVAPVMVPMSRQVGA
jgi:hypothetical protein